MNYEEINKAILNDRDIDENLVKKDEEFYRYLFNNKVAYYYAKYLSKNQTEKEGWIIRRGEELNEKYYRTLKLLKEICDANSIPFLLYKTHKYIPEVVDGDIDLIVHERDFARFFKVFREKGFYCVEDEPGKGKCIKEGFNVIEPHVTISWRGNDYVNPKKLWEGKEIIDDRLIFNALNPSLESGIRLMQVLYEPEYLSIYDIKFLRKFPLAKEICLPPSLENLYRLATLSSQFGKGPTFLGNSFFLIDWTRTFFQQGNIKAFALHILYFFYWKYRYKFLNILPFSHDWHEHKK